MPSRSVMGKCDLGHPSLCEVFKLTCFRLGVARDERKAFAELVHACDVALKESPVDLRAAKASNTIITPAQRRQLVVSKNRVVRHKR